MTNPESLSGWTRLTTGTANVDIIGRRRTWYIGFGVLIAVCLLSLVFRGFNLGIDFTGGSQIQLPATGANGAISTQQVDRVYEGVIGFAPEVTQSVGSGDAASIVLQSEPLTPEQLVPLREALFTQLQPLGADGAPSAASISDSQVSGTWGGEVTTQALIALAVFIVLVTLFLAFYFERAMAAAALIALVNDIVVTAGVYSIIGLEVTPATVIGLLTILGFSLYDTVVVFDKVRENSRGLLKLTRRTYAEAANLALNQTLMRSMNTSLIAILPVLGLLVIGVGLLGVGTLADLALVQLVGMIIGVVSSLLLATPVLVDIKLRDKRVRDQAARVEARRARAAGRGGTDSDVEDDPATDTLAAVSSSAPAAPRPGARPTGKTGRRRG
ncbi:MULTISPECIES: protein translocase subunit SecF [Pseudonocardia]|jgi:preprotein translocase subunit SecF|uniref:Protein-export membrane protein SecF n=1 Tax=Pseudonocardia alni TaxID=33907 RepID=A0A852WCP3_PSEA5|nr:MULTISPECIES: protein translocase subunit SecF [Pseudonocardia]MYW76413.1 protein translocase subunit SecF [Pseudonocardia sp. SID8383]NYG05101.1 preprotein translocase subunit SecF [Pseudonocardia antarctica]OJG07168.1 preprotein translocase subunit SecF [Pseudonocardia autotrophica]